MRGLLGKRHHHAQEDGLAPAKRHRKAASSTPASSAPVQDVPRDEPSNMAGLEDDEVMAVEAMGLLSAEKAPVAAAMPKQAWASTAGHHAEVYSWTCPSSIKDRRYCTGADFPMGLHSHVCSVWLLNHELLLCSLVHEVGKQGHETSASCLLV